MLARTGGGAGSRGGPPNTRVHAPPQAYTITITHLLSRAGKALFEWRELDPPCWRSGWRRQRLRQVEPFALLRGERTRGGDCEVRCAEHRVVDQKHHRATRRDRVLLDATRRAPCSSARSRPPKLRTTEPSRRAARTQAEIDGYAGALTRGRRGSLARFATRLGAAVAIALAAGGCAHLGAPSVRAT